MSAQPVRILLVEDNPGDARLLRELLRETPSLHFELTHVERLAEARARMADGGADVVLLDLSLPDAHGLETVTQMLLSAPEAAIVVLTGLDDETTAVQAVKAGAQDYLVKGQVDGALLARAIRYARERKQLEWERLQLLESEKEARAIAETAVLGRDEVLRVVAHDLGNSLSAVVVTTSVLQRILANEAPEGAARRHVANIRDLAEQMQRLRQDLLDVARLEAGRLSMEPIRLAPAVLTEVSLERYAALAAEKSITLECTAANGLPSIMADEARLLQVIANLLTNAIKFTPPQGRVTLNVEHGTDDEVRFSVTDSGPGIPPENLPNLFDRFWTTRKGNPHGAGLGLAIARGIVEAHGGRMWAESEMNVGSVFYFTLPVT
jgi:sigma-B regulation protein RsbU (phosphoserine phosphatase)